MSPDARLQKSIYDALKWEPSVDAAHVGLAVRDRIVTLSGHVASLAHRLAETAAVRAVKGVDGVADELDVRLARGHTRDDEDLALAAAWSLRWDVSAPAHKVQATVEHGRIALTGEVDWRYQATAAEENVRRRTGAVAVDNRLTIRPTVDVGHLQDDIVHALGRSLVLRRRPRRGQRGRRPRAADRLGSLATRAPGRCGHRQGSRRHRGRERDRDREPSRRRNSR